MWCGVTYLANPDATLEELSQTAAALDAAITPEGMTQRLTAAAATFLQQVLGAAITRMLAAEPLDIPLLARFTGVFIEDSTTIVLPDALRELWAGCGNATGQGPRPSSSTAPGSLNRPAGQFDAA